ncbi:MAG: hypothetical protein JOZ77_02935 [Candidatus Eremiobacteraeota bacterium]|nr:hypothetical protein [Candidatus Eremiobacteraeota bacterium]
MRTLPLLGLSLFAITFAACSSSGTLTGANPSAPAQSTAGRSAIGPNGVTPRHLANRHGWISPNLKPNTQLLYVSDEGDNLIDVFTVPDYSLAGQITDGIDQPEGIAVDKKGNLYVSNLSGNTVTVYPRGSTDQYQTLSEPDGPDDVAVTKNGYVLAGDTAGGVDVYAPGATSPTTRLTNSSVDGGVYGVGADAHNNAYAAGFGNSAPAVVEFKHLKGAGVNLGLTGMSFPVGVLVDKHGNIVESDFSGGFINIYPPGSTSPSSSISASEAERSSLNKAENLIYVPQGGNDDVAVDDYSSGTNVTTISIGNFTTGTALSPAPKP